VKGIVITQSLREENQMIVVMILIGGKTMTAYEAMLKSKEDAAGIMTSFLVMVLEGLFKKEISNISKKEIAMLVREVMDCEVEEVE
jgi:hypothetical protein